MLQESESQSDIVKVQWGNDFDPFEKGAIEIKPRGAFQSPSFKLPNGGIVYVSASEVPASSAELEDGDYRQLVEKDGKLILAEMPPRSVYDLSIAFTLEPAPEVGPDMICTLTMGNQQLIAHYSDAGNTERNMNGTGLFSDWQLEAISKP